MARGDQGKYTRVNSDWTKARKVTAPISIEELMEKEVQSSLEDGAMRELSVLADPENKDSTNIKQRIRILDHPKNLIEVLRTRLAIGKGIKGNNITTEPSQYRFTLTFLAGEVLHIFDLKSPDLRHKTVANLTIVMNMLLPILAQNSVSPSRNATSVTRWRSHESRPQGSMLDWFTI